MSWPWLSAGYLVFSIKWLLWMALLLSLGNAFESRMTAWIAEYWMKFPLLSEILIRKSF